MKHTRPPRTEVRTDDRIRTLPRVDLTRVGPFARL